MAMDLGRHSASEGQGHALGWEWHGEGSQREMQGVPLFLLL